VPKRPSFKVTGSAAGALDELASLDELEELAAGALEEGVLSADETATAGLPEAAGVAFFELLHALASMVAASDALMSAIVRR
jgi:hypothetical protein